MTLPAQNGGSNVTDQKTPSTGKNLNDLEAFARDFREWFANRFADFDSETNAQLLALDNAAAAALGDEQ